MAPLLLDFCKELAIKVIQPSTLHFSEEACALDSNKIPKQDGSTHWKHLDKNLQEEYLPLLFHMANSRERKVFGHDPI